jgi:hypothetical protein
VFLGNTPKGIEAGDAPKPLKTLKKKITRRGMLIVITLYILNYNPRV